MIEGPIFYLSSQILKVPNLDISSQNSEGPNLKLVVQYLETMTKSFSFGPLKMMIEKSNFLPF